MRGQWKPRIALLPLFDGRGTNALALEAAQLGWKRRTFMRAVTELKSIGYVGSDNRLTEEGVAALEAAGRYRSGLVELRCQLHGRTIRHNVSTSDNSANDSRSGLSVDDSTIFEKNKNVERSTNHSNHLKLAPVEIPNVVARSSVTVEGQRSAEAREAWRPRTREELLAEIRHIMNMTPEREAELDDFQRSREQRRRDEQEWLESGAYAAVSLEAWRYQRARERMDA